MATEVADTPELWPVDRTEDLYRSGLPFALRADVVRHPDQPDEEPFTRVVLEHPGAVVVLAVDDDERVLCLRQYRHPARMRMLELPAGLLDVAGEEPRGTAQRELLEEAGLEADDWTPLASAYSSPGITTEEIHYFLARGVRRPTAVTSGRPTRRRTWRRSGSRSTTCWPPAWTAGCTTRRC